MVRWLVRSHPCILRRALVHQEVLLLVPLLLPLFNFAHLFLLVGIGVGVLASAISLSHVVEIWLLNAHLRRRQAARVLLLGLLVVRTVTLILLRLVLALRARGSLTSRRLVLRAAHVRVHCICCVAPIGQNDVPIRWLIFVGDVLLHPVLLLHAPDDLPARSIHEIHHLPRHLAGQRLLLWRAPATLRRSVQLLLAVLVAAGAPLRIRLVGLRRLKDLLLVLAVSHDVVAWLLL